MKACFAIWSSSSQCPPPIPPPQPAFLIQHSHPLAQDENLDTASSLSCLPTFLISKRLGAFRGYSESFEKQKKPLASPVCLQILQPLVSENDTSDSLAARHVLGLVFVKSGDGSSTYSP